MKETKKLVEIEFIKSSTPEELNEIFNRLNNKNKQLQAKLGEADKIVTMLVSEIPKTLGEFNFTLLMQDLKGLLKILNPPAEEEE